MMGRYVFAAVVGLATSLLFAPAARASGSLPVVLQAKINAIARDALAESGVPSASIAVVYGGKLAYARAFGDARLNPKMPATTAMRYSVGSISKQFTAAALLLLQEQGRVSLDDKVARFFPHLTDARDITLRQLLSHTSGYQDYWPQDYVMPDRHKPTTPQFIIDTWAKKPLNFAPGTQWQYSNTNYVIAGAIIQKLTGQAPFAFLQQHVFKPLGMHTVYDNNLHALPATDALGYHRFALGPLRPAPAIGVNWMFGAGELAMTPSDLAKWDIAMLHQALLQPASWHAMETDVLLSNGLASGYGLGVFVGRLKNHWMISHDGEASGFTGANLVFPDDGDAVVVLTNQDAVLTSGTIARKIAEALFATKVHASADAREQARKVFTGLQHGKIDRALFSADANAYFNATALHDYADSLAPLGNPKTFTVVARHLRGGMVMRVYQADFKQAKLMIITYTLPGGKFEEFIVFPGA